jgi:hypothetical protein
MKLYVNAKSKKAINESLASGKTIYGENLSMFGDGGTYALSSAIPDGTVIAVYDKVVGGSPYPKAYGTWSAAKCMVKVLLFVLLSSGAFAQSTIKRDADGNFTQVSKSKEAPVKTGHWYKDSKGRKYDVYMNAKGRLFVIKTSAKTGKEYRYYLPIK